MVMTPRSSPLVLIGFDAASMERIERLVAQGRMPNIGHLVHSGTRGRLISEPQGPQAMIWPKWFEGGTAARWYYPKLWDPRRMRFRWQTAATGDPPPFWDELAAEDVKVAVIDVPQALVRRVGAGHLVLQGWQVHDLFERRSAPRDLWREFVARFGTPPMGPERYGPQTPKSLCALRRDILAATRQIGRIGAWVLKDRQPDVLVLVFGGLHRGGHYLWDLSQIDPSKLLAEERRELEQALDDIYVATDQAFGEIAEAAPAGARVLGFALHGMGTNDGWGERFQAIAERIVGQGAGEPARVPVLKRLKGMLPADLVLRATKMLPGSMGEHMVAALSGRLHDWTRTRWFVLPSDLNGMVRVNLAGREAAGIVRPGPEYRALLEELAERFGRLRDLDGRPIVRRIELTDAQMDPEDPARDALPDLSVLWRTVPSSITTGVALGDRELARWPLGEPLRSGRSGNHRPYGWFAAIGAGLDRHDTGQTFEIADLVPTIYRWLGLEPPKRLAGRPVEALLGQHRAAA